MARKVDQATPFGASNPVNTVVLRRYAAMHLSYYIPRLIYCRVVLPVSPLFSMVRYLWLTKVGIERRKTYATCKLDTIMHQLERIVGRPAGFAHFLKASIK
jgi:hypothetical protein